MQKSIILTIASILALVSSDAIAKSTHKKHRPVTKQVVVVKEKPKTLKSYIDYKCRKSCVDKDKLNNTIAKASEVYQVPHNVILGVIAVESAFNRKAKSVCGEGLMQVCPKWHKEKLVGENIYSVSTNVDVGTHILKDCLSKHKNNINKSLVCYNGGGDSHYVAKVRVAMREIKRLELANLEEVKWL